MIQLKVFWGMCSLLLLLVIERLVFEVTFATLKFYDVILKLTYQSEVIEAVSHSLATGIVMICVFFLVNAAEG